MKARLITGTIVSKGSMVCHCGCMPVTMSSRKFLFIRRWTEKCMNCGAAASGYSKKAAKNNFIERNR